jgi:hypothetical protein
MTAAFSAIHQSTPDIAGRQRASIGGTVDTEALEPQSAQDASEDRSQAS